MFQGSWVANKKDRYLRAWWRDPWSNFRGLQVAILKLKEMVIKLTTRVSSFCSNSQTVQMRSWGTKPTPQLHLYPQFGVYIQVQCCLRVLITQLYAAYDINGESFQETSCSHNVKDMLQTLLHRTHFPLSKPVLGSS
jgi:hypothetical protein